MLDSNNFFSPEQLADDLLWVINSPSLLAADDSHHALSADSIDRNQLQEFIMESRPKRVGRYFELLLLFWLTRVRKVNLVANNLPIRDGNLTLGEIDFLFIDEIGRLTHMEVAAKFYLYLPDFERTADIISAPKNRRSRYLGPNAKDNFEKKVDRVFEHQLPLSKPYFPDVQNRLAFMKGRIFYNPNCASPNELPPQLAGDHLRGRYVRHSQIDSLQRDDACRFKILAKPLWFTARPSTNEAMRFRELADYLNRHFSKHEHAVLLYRFGSPSIGSSFDTDEDYIFVISDRWPE